MLRTDDIRVLIASREEARRNFDSHRRLGIDTPMRINHAVEVANLLKHNLVQGVRESDQEDANWGMSTAPISLFFFEGLSWYRSVVTNRNLFRTPDSRRHRERRQRYDQDGGEERDGFCWKDLLVAVAVVDAAAAAFRGACLLEERKYHVLKNCIILYPDFSPFLWRFLGGYL